MAEDFLGDRKRALEEEFFRKQEAALREKAQAAGARQTAKQALGEASGVKDSAVLDHLVDLGIQADTLLALSLVPLVEVAWADGHLDDRERKAVVAAIEASGIVAGSPAHDLVESWLKAAPARAMLDAWTAYTRGLCRALSPSERETLRGVIMGRARSVANAAGGFLGLGSKMSREEEAMLRRLEQAFSG